MNQSNGHATGTIWHAGIGGGQELLHLSELCASHGSQPVLHAVSFSLRAGQRIALTGPGGSGKSTLLSIIAGRPGHASVVSGLIQRSLLPIYHMPQNAWPGDIPLAELVTRRLGLDPEQRARRLQQLWPERPDLIPVLIEATQELATQAGGDLRRLLEFSLALAGRESLLLLDEPDALEDDMLREAVTLKLQALPADRSLLLVSHNKQTISRTCTDAVRLLDGRIRDQGSTASVLSSRLDLRPFPVADSEEQQVP
ncbi:ABC-F family ATP-binding cassette domain-containing protein [bacterium]|nr:ABC-F family ATP-binding cassette domain-containing protein [bacterium]